MVDKNEEAAKLLKKGLKFLSPSILEMRLKPDWEAAAPLLDRAALLFKQSGNVEKALETYERAATAQDKIGSPWHAGKHMETAAELCRQHKQMERVSEFYKNAAEYYISAQKNTIAADCLAKGAKAIEEFDAETAIAMLFDAVDIYESDTRDNNASDVFRQGISTCIKAKHYPDAVDLLMRFGTMCERTNARSSQCRCYLGAVVVHLYAQQPKQAWQLFQDVLAVDVFVSSEEAFAADALFNAYRAADEELVKRVVSSKPCFKQLDNQVARLALKLPQGRMEKMARRLNRVMGPEDDGEGAEDGGEGGGEHGDEVL